VARQVLPWVGAAVGFVASGGNPMGAQAGFAIGSLIGNAIDPVEMQGRKLGDSPTQTAAEGGARAIVFGKGCIRATVILERGGRRVVKQRDKSGGKGSGPTTVNERAFWTYAIGICEATPDGGLLRIWENEKLVYDVTPTSQIVEDSTEFAKLFRFYDGAEDQLPDPAIEAIYTDPTDAPYYRGTAYMVFPQRDLTDFGEAVPTYRVEVVSEVDVSIGDEVLADYVIPGTYSSAYIFPRADGDLGFLSATTPLESGDDYTVGRLDNALNVVSSSLIETDSTGAPGARDLWPRGINESGALVSADDIFGYCKLFSSGNFAGTYLPSDAGTLSWWYAENFYAPEYGGLVWFGDDAGGAGSWYLGVRRTSGSGGYTNRLIKFPISSGEDTPEQVLLTGVGTTTNPRFWMSRGRDGFIHIIEQDGTYRKFNSGLAEVDSRDLGITVSDLRGFGVDGAVIAMVYGRPANGRVVFHDISSGSVLRTIEDANLDGDEATRVVFTGDRCYIQCRAWVGAISYSPGFYRGTIPLSSIIAEIHQRSGHGPADYDVAELTEEVAGVVIESTVTGAEAINSIIGCHFADPSDYDGKIHYVKRGKPVVKTLTADDLIDEPETWQRNNAIEYPAKVHFFGQIAELAYASVKATSARYSADAKVVGEASVSSPETFNTSQRPYEIAAILHKIMWTEAGGEVTWRVTDQHLDLVPTDCVGLSWAGQLWRARITQIEADPGELKLKMMLDRQSAYTANLTAIPIPPAPTPPQTGIMSDTVLAVMDIPALVDAADDLHLVTAMSGETDAWAGAQLQRSLDAGASFGTVSSSSSSLNAIMGRLQSPVTAASPHYTDTTNAVEVVLFTDDDIESISEQAFLSEGGAFALSWDDGGTQRWELLQYRDAELIAPKTYRLTTLHRGQLNTEVAAHPTGATFVLLDGAVQRHPTQSAWIGTDLAHRAVSIGQTPDGADEQTLTYAGNSQREWAPAHVFMERPSPDAVTARVVPRHRFGTDDAPIRSTHWSGYRWIVTDGTNTITRDGLSETEIFATIGWAPDVDVSVAQVNAITGAGPYISTFATQAVPPSVGGSVIVAKTSNSGMQGGPTLGSTDFVPWPAPMGIESGDALLAYVYAGSAITAPSGWTLIESATASTATIAVYRKDTVTTANAGEVFPWSVADGFSLRLLRYALIRSSTGIVSIAASNSAVTSKVGATYPHTVSMAPATAVNNNSVAIAFAGTPSMTPVWWGTGPMVLSGEGPERGTGENCAFGIERVNANQTSDASIIARAIVIPPPPPVSGTAYYGAVNVILEAG